MTHLGSKSGLLVQALDNQDKLGRSNLLQDLFIDDIQSRLVDQSNVQSFLSESVDSVDRSVEHISVGDDVTLGSLSDELVFARFELVVLVVESRSVFLEDPRDLGSGGEDESDSLVVEYSVYHTRLSARSL